MKPISNTSVMNPRPAPLSPDLPAVVPRRAVWTALAGAGLFVMTGGLGGCGFALRQAPKFAFSSLRVAVYVGTPVSRALQRELAASGIQVVNTAAVAGQPPVQVVLDVLQDQRERAVVGQTASGQVRELQLRTRFRYRLSTPSGKRLIEETEMLLERDISFTETGALAKAAEEQLMFNDMQGDIVQQVMRRLAAVKSL